MQKDVGKGVIVVKNKRYKGPIKLDLLGIGCANLCEGGRKKVPSLGLKMKNVPVETLRKSLIIFLVRMLVIC